MDAILQLVTVVFRTRIAAGRPALARIERIWSHVVELIPHLAKHRRELVHNLLPHRRHHACSVLDNSGAFRESSNNAHGHFRREESQDLGPFMGRCLSARARAPSTSRV